MKNLLLIIGCLIVLNVAKAQKNDLKFGTRVTLGQSELMGDQFQNKNAGLYIGMGGTANYQFNRMFGLMGDLMIVKKSAYIRDNESGGFIGNPNNYEYSDRYNFYQLEVPMMAKLRLGGEHFGFRLFAGPSFGFNLLSTQSRVYDNREYDEQYGYRSEPINNMNVLEKGMVYGLGIEILSKQNELFFVDLRNSHSLTPLGRVNDNDIRINNFALSLGWLF